MLQAYSCTPHYQVHLSLPPQLPTLLPLLLLLLSVLTLKGATLEDARGITWVGSSPAACLLLLLLLLELACMS